MELESRVCPQCQQNFRVTVVSKQVFCSRECDHYMLCKTGNGKEIFKRIRKYQQEGLKPMPQPHMKPDELKQYAKVNRIRRNKKSAPTKIHLTPPKDSSK